MDPTSKKKILAVDDDLDTLDIIRIKLEGAGYAVDTATDGHAALHKIKMDVPDLLILDIMLPKLSGFKVARILKFDSVLKTLPIIILTARTQAKDRTLGKQVGAEEYVTKPFDPDSLLSLVNKHISKEGG